MSQNVTARPRLKVFVRVRVRAGTGTRRGLEPGWDQNRAHLDEVLGAQPDDAKAAPLLWPQLERRGRQERRATARAVVARRAPLAVEVARPRSRLPAQAAKPSPLDPVVVPHLRS